MFKSATFLGLSAAALFGATRATATPPPPAAGSASIDLELILETNVTDNDAEIVLELGSDVAVDRLFLFGPMGRQVLSVKSNDGENLGLAEIVVESAEPSIPAVLAAWPEGAYVARVRTTTRGWVVVPVALDHDLLPEPQVTAPLDGQGVPVNGGVVTWTADPDAESYSLEIEQDDLELSLAVELPGSVTSFAIPDGFLVSGEEFDLGLAAEGENGNVTATELSFSVQ